jgi:hypothetical protein
MKTAGAIQATVFLLFAISSAISRPADDPEIRRSIMSSQNPYLDPGLPEGVMHVTAAADTHWWDTWTFDTGGDCLHDEPNEPLGLPGDHTSQYWSSEDLTENTPCWHATDGSALDPGIVLEGNYSAWCGWVDLCPDPPGVLNSGYRDDQVQQLYRTFELGANPGNISYKYYADSESVCDFTYLIASPVPPSGDCSKVTGTVLATYTGNIGYGLDTINLAAFANTTVTLVFVFESDESWSDEDGLYSTSGVGPFTVDSITVTVDSGTNEYFDFESGDLDGWSRCAFSGYGDYAGIYDRSGLIIQDSTCPCINGCVLAFSDGKIPGGHPANQLNIAYSPAIDLTDDPQWPRGTSVLRYGQYLDLPAAAGVFSVWKVRYRPSEDDLCGLCDRWSPWYDLNYVYVSEEPECGVAAFEVSGMIPSHAEYAQVAVGAWNFAGGAGAGNASPLYDNITFGVTGARAPGISMEDWDFFQDSFAIDGTNVAMSVARIDRARNVSQTAGVTVLGDYLICRSPSGCPSSHPRGVDIPDAVVNLFFRVFPGECINETAFNEWHGSFPTIGAWRYARMDTARSEHAPYGLIPGSYMSRFHELDPNHNPVGDNDILPDNLFTPGTTIEYFVEAHWHEAPWGPFNVYPDTTGGIYQEVEILPDIMNPNMPCDDWVNAHQNRFLYVDHFRHREAQDVIERGFHALGLGPVTQGSNGWPDLQLWDRYDTQAPGFDQGNSLGGRICQTNLTDPDGPRVNGPTLNQIKGYRAIFWNAGDMDDKIFAMATPTNCADDIGLLTSWLDWWWYPDSVLLWIEADGIATDIGATPFARDYLGIDLIASSYAIHTSHPSWCPDVDGVVGGWAPVFHCGLEQVFYGTCGPILRDFDVLRTWPGTQAAEGVLEYARQAGPGEYASVSHNAMADTATFSTYKTVTDGFSVHHLRKYAPYCDSDVCVAWWIANVLGGPFFDKCFGNLQAVAEDYEYSPGFDNCLGHSYPNPMNPSATIDYSVKESGRVTLRVFDASGRLITTLVDRVLPAGSYQVEWDGRNASGQLVGSAVYFYQLEANGYRQSRKIVLLK